jgi:hypothetical protein
VTPPAKIALCSSGALVAVLLVCFTVGHGWGRAFLTDARAARRQDWQSVTSGERAARMPRIVLWAWERPEDLRFLKAGQAGVAFLAKTIYLQTPTDGSPSSNAAVSSAPAFKVRPRLQPLRITAGTPLIAVVRIENPGASSGWQAEKAAALHAASYAASASQREQLASEIASLQFLPDVSGIQIDFDAPTSAHQFYTALLQEVRSRLPDNFSLSITALASWCLGDRWLERLPSGTIDEAVPMLFRLGPDASEVARFLRLGREFPVAACQSSLGLSIDERISADILTGQFSGLVGDFREKRLYVFSPYGQTAKATAAILEAWQR